MIDPLLKERIITNASVASALNRFLDERIFGVDDNGLVGVLGTGNTVEKPDDDARYLMNGILSVLGLQETN